MSLAGVSGWVGLLALLHIQMGLLSWLLPWVGLVAVLHGQGLLVAGLCNHFWLSRFAHCVSWWDSAYGWIPWWGGLRAVLHNCWWLDGASGCFPTKWCHWLESVFRQDSRPGFEVRWGLSLWSVIRQGHMPCWKLGGAAGRTLWSGRPLIMLCCWVRSLAVLFLRWAFSCPP